MVHSSMRSIQQRLVHMIHRIELKVHSNSMKHMVMGKILHSIQRLMVRSSREWWLMVHRNRSIQLLMVHIHYSFEWMVRRSNMRYMEMAHILERMMKLMLHSSRVECLVHNSMRSMKLQLVHKQCIHE